MAEPKKNPVTIVLSKSQVADAIKSYLKSKMEVSLDKIKDVKWHSNAVVILKN